jgi:hypothetical protein
LDYLFRLKHIPESETSFGPQIAALSTPLKLNSLSFFFLFFLDWKLTWLLEAPGKVGGCVTASVALAPKHRHGSDGHGHVVTP